LNQSQERNNGIEIAVSRHNSRNMAVKHESGTNRHSIGPRNRPHLCVNLIDYLAPNLLSPLNFDDTYGASALDEQIYLTSF